jgi:hypothetical protein
MRFVPCGLYTTRPLMVWNLESYQRMRTLEGHTAWVDAVTVTPGRFEGLWR